MLLDGRYETRAELHAGALGVVTEAYDRDLSRLVAVKLVGEHPDAPPDLFDRLVRQAHAMARISHPNVVEVFDVRRYDDGSADPGCGVAIVMELVRGPSLATWLETPRSATEILATFIAAGQGLAAAHARGVVHRDFNPSNVLVGDDGRVKVTDFGLAAALGNRSGEGTTDGASADEATQIHGPGESTDARSDQQAFCAAALDALHAADATQGRRVAPRVRAALQRGMADDPRDRFASMQALLEHMVLRPVRGRWAVVGVVALPLAAGAVALTAYARAPAPVVVPSVAEVSIPAATIPSASVVTPHGWAADRAHLTDRPRPTETPFADERRAIYTQMDALRAFEDPDTPRAPKLDRLTALLDRAEALGDLSLQSEMLLSRAAMEVGLGDLPRGTATAERAYDLAVEVDSHVLAATAAALLFAYQEDESPQGERWRRTAETHIEIAGGVPRAEKYLEDMLARIEARAGRFDEALVHGERLVTLSEEVEGIDHPRVGYAHVWNAMYHAELGNLARAEQAVVRGIAVLQHSYPDTHSSILQARAELASLLAKQGRATEARLELDRALADLAAREAMRGTDWVSEEVLWDAANTMLALQLPQDALTYYRRIIPLLPDEPDYWNGFSLHREIAQTLLLLGRKAEAADALRESLKYVTTESAEWEQRTAAREQLALLERELRTTAATPEP